MGLAGGWKLQSTFFVFPGDPPGRLPWVGRHYLRGFELHVSSLRLSHFRNYESMEVEFHPQLNLFLGSNAQGKTNILEALFCLSTTRSFRAAADEEMIQFGQDAGSIEGMLQREEGLEQIRLELRKNKNKALFVNGKKQKKLSSLLGRLPAVVF